MVGGTQGNPLLDSSIVSTCYTAGGMPLAFTQEHYLVILGNVCQFTICGGVPHPRSGCGGYPVPGLGGGYPISGLDGGEGTHPRSGWWGEYLIPGLVGGGYPIPGLDGGGYPIPGLDGGGYPILGLDGGGYPRRYLGYPPGQVWMVGGTWYEGTPHHDWMGYAPPHHHDWMGYPPPHTSIASTCYAVGGMPLAFTQEDFLVVSFLCVFIKYISKVFGQFFTLRYINNFQRPFN